jgi:DMSO/TMAO reductase YedYZ molybdopterin-dependent catalytic subunit
VKRRSFLRLALLALAGCTIPPSLVFRPDGTAQPAPTEPEDGATAVPAAADLCNPFPKVAPTPPIETIGPDLLDASTGLHVKNYEVVQIDPVSYRLKVSGLVDYPLELTLDDLCAMPKVTQKVVCTCRGYFEDFTTYSGVPLTYVMGLAGVQSGAKAVYLTGAEGYAGYLSLDDALLPDNFLAYQWKDQPLPILHGYPLRAVIASKMGYTWTKYLVEIKVESE